MNTVQDYWEEYLEHSNSLATIQDDIITEKEAFIAGACTVIWMICDMQQRCKQNEEQLAAHYDKMIDDAYKMLDTVEKERNELESA